MGTQNITGVGTNITATGALTITATGAAIDLTLSGRGAGTTLNEAGQTSLAGFTATSIIGALNELAAGGAGLWQLNATLNPDVIFSGSTYDVVIGGDGSTLNAPFAVDVSDSAVGIGAAPVTTTGLTLANADDAGTGITVTKTGAGASAYGINVTNSATSTTVYGGRFITDNDTPTSATALYASAGGATNANTGLQVLATGAATTNTAIYASASNGTTNYAIYSTAGLVDLAVGTLTSAQNALRVTAIGPASASADGGEIFYTAGIMNGSDTQRALFIDVTNAASHSSTGNVLSGVYVDGITTRANVTQYGLYVGSGWEFANGRTQLQAGNLATGQYGLYLSAEGPAGGSATANQIEFTAGAMDGSDAQQGIYVSVLNADHEGASNTLSGVYINELDMADDEATEYGMYLDSNNWDYGLYIAGGAGMDVLYVAGTANFTGNVDAESGLDVTGKLDVAAGTIASTLEGVYVSGTGTANVSSELIQLDHTMGNMNGGDTQKSLYINITDGTYSTIGSPNYVYGIDIDKSAAPDIDAFEYGINIGNGWDTGVNVAIGNAGSRGFNAAMTGTSGSNYGGYFSAAGAGIGTNNYGIYATATGGTTNYAGYFASGTTRVDGTFDANGVLYLGDGGDAGTISTNDWGIDSTGNMTNIGTITADGAIDFTNASVEIAQYLYHYGDADTYFDFETNQIIAEAGNIRFLDMQYQGGGPTAHRITINEDSQAVQFYVETVNNAEAFTTVGDNVTVNLSGYAGTDFTVESDTNANMLKVNSGNNRVGVGRDPSYIFDVYGDPGAANWVASIFADGNNSNRYGLRIQAGADAGDAYHIVAYDGNAGEVGHIGWIGGTFQLVSTSDRRTKTNIDDAQVNGLDIVNSLKVRQYNRTQNPDTPLIYGFVAQEAQEVFPRMVSQAPSGMLAVGRSELIPILTKAIQEQQAQIDELRVSGGGDGTPIEPGEIAGDLGITGNVTVGGDLDVAGTAKVSSIWSQNATWHIDSQGELFVQNIQTQDIEIADGENKAVGSGSIPVGQSEVVIENTSVTDKSYILITIGGYAQARASGAISDNLKVKQIDAGRKFIVSTIDNQPATEEIPFGYLIIN